MAEHLNKDASIATHWKGRVLLWLNAEDAKYPQAGKELCLDEPDSDDEEDEQNDKKGKGGDEESQPLLSKGKQNLKETQQDKDKIFSAFQLNNQKIISKYTVNDKVQKMKYIAERKGMYELEGFEMIADVNQGISLCSNSEKYRVKIQVEDHFMMTKDPLQVK